MQWKKEGERQHASFPIRKITYMHILVLLMLLLLLLMTVEIFTIAMLDTALQNDHIHSIHTLDVALSNLDRFL